jgi:hypothetical protein
LEEHVVVYSHDPKQDELVFSRALPFFKKVVQIAREGYTPRDWDNPKCLSWKTSFKLPSERLEQHLGLFSVPERAWESCTGRRKDFTAYVQDDESYDNKPNIKTYIWQSLEVKDDVLLFNGEKYCNLKPVTRDVFIHFQDFRHPDNLVDELKISQ